MSSKAEGEDITFTVKGGAGPFRFVMIDHVGVVEWDPDRLAWIHIATGMEYNFEFDSAAGILWI